MVIFFLNEKIKKFYLKRKTASKNIYSEYVQLLNKLTLINIQNIILKFIANYIKNGKNIHTTTGTS